MIIYNSNIVPIGYKAIAIYPFIFYKYDKYTYDSITFNHEKIHLRQQIELLIVFFYLLYFINYLINRFRFKSHDEAYSNIVFEREANDNECNFNYLKKRKLFAWKKHINE